MPFRSLHAVTALLRDVDIGRDGRANPCLGNVRRHRAFSFHFCHGVRACPGVDMSARSENRSLPIQAATTLRAVPAYFDTPLSSVAALPQLPLPFSPHSWLQSTNPLTLPWLVYTSFNPSCRFPLRPSLPLLPRALILHPCLPFTPPFLTSFSFPFLP